MALLYFLESIRNPVMNAMMSAITLLGGEVIQIGVPLIVFWCMSKKYGYYLMSISGIGLVINQILKIFFMIPRPWIVDPNFTIVETARADATGYSFPSGHVQNVTAIFGGIARFTKRPMVRIICVVLVLLVLVSRMYLGVHTPSDVFTSLLIAGGLVFVLYAVCEKAEQKPDIMLWLLGAVFLISVGGVLFSAFYPFSAEIDTNHLATFYKYIYSVFGYAAGIFVSYPIEKRFVKFSEKASLPGHIVKVIVGLAVIMIVTSGLELLFFICPEDINSYWIHALRCFVIMVMGIVVCPLLFKFLDQYRLQKIRTKKIIS